MAAAACVAAVLQWLAAATPTFAQAAHGLAERGRGVITARVAAARPGDVVVVEPGIYRGETIRFVASGRTDAPITIRAAELGGVVVRGSAVLEGWDRVAGDHPIYRYAGWLHGFDPIDDTGATGDARGLPRNQVFVDGEPLAEAVTRAELAPGRFFVDRRTRAIELWLADAADPNEHLIEAADTEGPLLSTNDQSHIVVVGVSFEHGANRPQGDALVQITGESCTLRDVVVRWAAGAGVSIRGRGHLVERCRFTHNGQLGLHSTRAEDCRILDTELAYNNTLADKRFDPAWEAGGCKITRSRRFVVERVRAHHNLGSGIWFDIDNHDARIADCVSHDNAVGIHYEISYTGEITGNHCFRNSLQGAPIDSPGGQGIYISSSAGCTVSDNLCHDNDTRGIEVWGPVRDDGAGRRVASVSNRLTRNTVVNNQRANPNATDLLLGYGSDPKMPLPEVDATVPVEANTADHNRYFRADGRPFFWLPGGDRAATLDEWRQRSGQDHNSVWAPTDDPR